MIVDSTFIVDVLRDVDQATRLKVQELDTRLQARAVTSITTMELWSGAFRSADPQKNIKAVKKVMRMFINYSFTEEDAALAGEIEADLMKRGEKISIEDIMIAAIALNKNETVLTRNVKHFSRIKGLKVENY